MLANTDSILALDIGGRRIGVASANAVARIASPLTTLENNEAIAQTLQSLINEQGAAILVIGLPRNLSGQATTQTADVETFAKNLKQVISLPIYWQDEAVTSMKAEEELKARKKPYKKGDIDALAATYILEDFLNSHPEVKA